MGTEFKFGQIKLNTKVFGATEIFLLVNILGTIPAITTELGKTINFTGLGLFMSILMGYLEENGIAPALS